MARTELNGLIGFAIKILDQTKQKLPLITPDLGRHGQWPVITWKSFAFDPIELSCVYGRNWLWYNQFDVTKRNERNGSASDFRRRWSNVQPTMVTTSRSGTQNQELGQASRGKRLCVRCILDYCCLIYLEMKHEILSFPRVALQNMTICLFVPSTSCVSEVQNRGRIQRMSAFLYWPLTCSTVSRLPGEWMTCFSYLSTSADHLVTMLQNNNNNNTSHVSRSMENVSTGTAAAAAVRKLAWNEYLLWK